MREIACVLYFREGQGAVAGITYRDAWNEFSGVWTVSLCLRLRANAATSW